MHVLRFLVFWNWMTQCPIFSHFVWKHRQDAMFLMIPAIGGIFFLQIRKSGRKENWCLRLNVRFLPIIVTSNVITVRALCRNSSYQKWDLKVSCFYLRNEKLWMGMKKWFASFCPGYPNCVNQPLIGIFYWLICFSSNIFVPCIGDFLERNPFLTSLSLSVQAKLIFKWWLKILLCSENKPISFCLKVSSFNLTKLIKDVMREIEHWTKLLSFIANQV